MTDNRNATRLVVAVPSFNASATITETLEALQRCDRLDRISLVLVHDDGSTDDTALRAQAAWHREAPELRIVGLPTNVGQNNNVNKMMSYAGQLAEWVLILHADDVVKRNWLTLTISAIEEADENVASVCSSYDCWYSDTGKVVVGEDHPDRPHVIVRGGAKGVVRTLAQGCWWHISGCAIRVDHFRNIGEFRPDLDLGDFDWLLRCQALGLSIRYIPRTTMLYRLHENAISTHSHLVGRDVTERVEIFREYERLGYLDRGTRRRLQREMMVTLLRRGVGQIIGRRPRHLRHLLRAFYSVVKFREFRP